MSPSEDPFVDTRRLFPLGPSYDYATVADRGCLVPFGVRYAVSAPSAASGGTTKRVSLNRPTSPDGEPGKEPEKDDVMTEGTD